jgi:hypothetical protein
MFRCQFSGELSDGAQYRYEWARGDDPKDRNLGRVMLRAAEKPVRVAVEFRSKSYTNENGEVIGEGREIVKELLIRARHLDAVKRKYGLD